MPFNGTTWVNWTTSNATSGAGGIVNTVITNIPWAFTFILILFYVVMFIYMQDDPGRKKYLYITFVGVLAAGIMRLFKLVPVGTVLGAIGLFVLTAVFVIATSD